MGQMIIQHEVKDFTKWKTIFDLSAPIRRMSGERSVKIFRNGDNLNDVTILIDWKDLSKAIEYAESENLRTSMKEAGVIGTPKVYLTEEELKA